MYTQTCLRVLFRNVRYKFRKVRNNVAGKDASMLEQQFEDFEQQKRRDHQAQDQSKSAKQKRDRLNPPDWSQVTKAGWNMLDSISEKVPRAFRLYSFFAQNIDKSCGAVVCDQKFLADYFGVSLRTIQYWIGDLESIGAIVKIPVGIYYAYALDPYQVWRGYNKSKKYAAFNAKTLTQKDGVIDRYLRLMLSRREEFEGSLKTSNHDLD